MRTLPPGVWDNPTADELDAYDGFVVAWNDEEEAEFVSILGDSGYDTFLTPPLWPSLWIPGINIEHEQARGLVVAMPIWEGDGKTMFDYSGHGNHGTLPGFMVQDTDWSLELSDPFGQVFRAKAGGGAWFRVSANNSLRLDGKNYGFGIWVRPWKWQTPAASDMALIRQEGVGIEDESYSVLIRPNQTVNPTFGTIVVTIGLSTGSMSVSSVIDGADLDEWCHIFVTVTENGSNWDVTLYTNGVAVDTASSANNPVFADEDLIIFNGLLPDIGTDFYEGDAKDIRVYGRTVSAAAVYDIFRNGADLYEQPDILVFNPNRLIAGASTLTGTASLTASTTFSVGGETTLTATASISDVVTMTHGGKSTPTATASMNAEATMIHAGTANLQGVATLTMFESTILQSVATMSAVAAVIHPADANLQATATLDEDATQIHSPELTLTGTATMGAKPFSFWKADADLSCTAVMNAEEAGTAIAVLIGTATLSSLPLMTLTGDTTLTGTATISDSGVLGHGGIVTMTGTATMDVTGEIGIVGGILVGGAAKITSNEIEQVTGGLLAGGKAKFGVIQTGEISLTATATISDNAQVDHSGIVILSCSASITARATHSIAVILGTGGAVAGGIAKITSNETKQVTGGLLTGGKAIIVSVHAVGADLNATATMIPIDLVQPFITGGVVAAGTASVSHVRAEIVSGGVVVAGKAIAGFNHQIVETLSGTASLVLNELVARRASATLNATASIPADGALTYKTILGTGGMVAGGSATINWNVQASPTGGVVLGGKAINGVPKLAAAILTAFATIDDASVMGHGGRASLLGTATIDPKSALTIVSSLVLESEATMSFDPVMLNAAIANLLGTATLKASLEPTPDHILKALRSFLITDSTISTLIGTKMYPLRLPEKAVLPAISYRRISHEHEHHLDGAAGFATPRIQIDCWSNNLSECKQISEAVRSALQGYGGLMDSVNAMSVVLDNEVHLHEAPQDASESWIFHIAQDYLILHNETVPAL